MKKICLCLVVIMLLAVGTAAAGPAGVIGVVDGQKLMAESTTVQVLQTQLNQKGQEINKRLEEAKTNLAPEQFKEKQNEAYKEFIQLKQELQTQIDNSIRQAAEQVAKEKNLALIVLKDSIAFGGIDVTDDVIKKMK